MASARDLHRDAFDAELLAKIRGERQAVGGHRPFLIEDPGKVWLVLRGHIDVYAIEMAGDRPASTGRSVMRLGAGAVLFGVPSLDLPSGGAGDRLALRAVAAMGTELYEGRAEDVLDADFDIIAVDWIDSWVGHLSRAIAEGALPRQTAILDAEPLVEVPARTDLCAQVEDTVWARVEAGRVRFLGDERGVMPVGEPALPVTEWTWIRCETEARLACAYTPTLLFQGEIEPALAAFHARVLPAIHAEIMAARDEEAARGRRADSANREAFTGAVRALGGVLGGREAERAQAETDARAGTLFAAFARVAAASGIAARRPPVQSDLRGVDPVLDLARASGARVRRVTLSDGWHRREHGPLLGWTAAEGRPVALLPARWGYEMLDPEEGAPRRVTRALAATLADDAAVFSPRLPETGARAAAVLRAVGAADPGGSVRVAALAVLAALLGLALPVGAGWLVGEAVPRADAGTILAIAVGLGVAAISAAAVRATLGLSALRLVEAGEARLHAGIWDRLLALPVSFFRRESTGDLADRANGTMPIRDAAVRLGAEAAASLALLAAALVLVLGVEWRLGLATAALTGGFGWLTWRLARADIESRQSVLDRMGRLDALIVQLFAGFSKLRSTGAEPRAFARWAAVYRDIVSERLAIARRAAAQETLGAGFVGLVALAFFAVLVMRLGEGRAPGLGEATMLAVALGQIVGAALRLGSGAARAAEAVPHARRLAPVLAASPEAGPAALDPGELTGRIDISRATFRYAPGTPPVLDRFGLSVKPGEFVAIVGKSGSGKSTVLRLLLGFERPETGGVYYDGQDLAGLDLGAVRRQIGSVLQGSQLMAGTIRENILGDAPLGERDAREAVRLAGLEEDIAAMPDGLDTLVSEGSGGLSGGQKQRLMIARALVRHPRILVLDEATSALDNQTQARVNAGLERLNLTRIVVAQRLTTVVNAHRIIVMDAGRIVEEGRYSALMAGDGPFAAMARRQLI